MMDMLVHILAIFLDSLLKLKVLIFSIMDDVLLFVLFILELVFNLFIFFSSEREIVSFPLPI